MQHTKDPLDTAAIYPLSVELLKLGFFVGRVVAAGLGLQMNRQHPRMHADLCPALTGSAGKVVIGTVKGDLHDIGKNIVSTMLTGAGFEVYDLGIDVPDEKFLKKALEIQPDFIGMSSLLTTTMLNMKSVIKLLKDHGIREKLKIVVGGAVVTQSFADEIGADFYAKDAMECTKKARNWIKTKKGVTFP